MTGISDAYIAEAALVAPVGVAAPKKKPFASLSRVLHSGLGVACICLIAVAALLMGTATVGRIATPAPEGTPPLARFGFTYTMRDSDGTAMPGDTVSVDTTIINRGLPFVYHGSSASYHPEAYFVLQGNESISMQCTFMETCDSGPHAVTMGMEGGGYGEITIPADAIPGVYDLVLSYKGTVQVYKGVLTVEESTEDPSAQFEFDYTMQDAEGNVHDGFVRPGEFFSVLTTVTNKGKSFRCVEWEYFANACFVLHGDETVRIAGDYAIPDSATPMIKTVENGESGLQRIMFTLPQSTVPGVYDLVLSYGGYSQTFERVLTVAEPTVIDPAVLYNLTMPIGSDWLYEPIDEAYVGGEEVTVRIKFATDVGTLFFLNGEVITPSVGDNQHGYWNYHFIMPKKDSEIIFHTYDGTAPYSGMLKDYILEHPRIERADLQYYYGEYGDGAMVALLGGGVYGQLETETIVGGYSFWTHEVIPIMVWQDGIFCELPEAYEQGIITDEHLADIFALHKTGFRSYYDDD